MPDDLITTRAAAKLLGVGTTSIKRWADDGTLACVRTAGGHRRFVRGDVVRLFEAGDGRSGEDEPADELLARLPRMTPAQLDALDFGVIQLDDAGCIVQYNAFEERFAHRRRDDVRGSNFFTQIAPCTNNTLLYEPFRAGVAAGVLDLKTDYTFTYKMAARVVSLHLHREPESATNWLLVRPRA